MRDTRRFVSAAGVALHVREGYVAPKYSRWGTGTTIDHRQTHKQRQ
jgi:hypothetical protein